MSPGQSLTRHCKARRLTVIQTIWNVCSLLQDLTWTGRVLLVDQFIDWDVPLRLSFKTFPVSRQPSRSLPKGVPGCGHKSPVTTPLGHLALANSPSGSKESQLHNVTGLVLHPLRFSNQLQVLGCTAAAGEFFFLSFSVYIFKGSACSWPTRSYIRLAQQRNLGGGGDGNTGWDYKGTCDKMFSWWNSYHSKNSSELSDYHCSVNKWPIPCVIITRPAWSQIS